MIKRKREWGRVLVPGGCIAIVAAIWGWVLWISTEPPPKPAPQDTSAWAAERRECDKQVAILLATHDAVELERAKFLVRWLNCDVSGRLLRS